MGTPDRYQVVVNEKKLEIETEAGKTTSGKIGAKPYALDIVGSEEHGFSVIYDKASYKAEVIKADYTTKEFIIRVNGVDFNLQAADRFDLLLKELGMEHLTAAAVNDLKAPMPGLVLKVNVKPGDEVKKGQALVVLEAMKMENVLKAENDGLVKSVECSEGGAVDKNQVLISFEA
jgi:acetyl/propionyl-CoA carboxylase alpha subunit